MKKIPLATIIFIGFFTLLQAVSCQSGSDKNTSADTVHTSSPVDSMPVVQPEADDSSHIVTPPSTHDSNVVVPKQ